LKQAADEHQITSEKKKENELAAKLAAKQAVAKIKQTTGKTKQPPSKQVTDLKKKMTKKVDAVKEGAKEEGQAAKKREEALTKRLQKEEKQIDDLKKANAEKKKQHELNEKNKAQIKQRKALKKALKKDVKMDRKAAGVNTPVPKPAEPSKAISAQPAPSPAPPTPPTEVPLMPSGVQPSHVKPKKVGNVQPPSAVENQGDLQDVLHHGDHPKEIIPPPVSSGKDIKGGAITNHIAKAAGFTPWKGGDIMGRGQSPDALAQENDVSSKIFQEVPLNGQKFEFFPNLFAHKEGSQPQVPKPDRAAFGKWFGKEMP